MKKEELLQLKQELIDYRDSMTGIVALWNKCEDDELNEALSFEYPYKESFDDKLSDTISWVDTQLCLIDMSIEIGWKLGELVKLVKGIKRHMFECYGVKLEGISDWSKDDIELQFYFDLQDAKGPAWYFNYNLSDGEVKYGHYIPSEMLNFKK